MCQRNHRKSNEDPGKMGILNQALAYLKVLRPVNLIIVGLTQAFLQYYVIQPIFKESTVLHGMTAPLFFLATMLIAAGGYLINDIFDQETDVINKPQNTFIPRPISLASAKLFYLLILMAGLILSVAAGLRAGAIHLIWIYPLAAGLLYVYSRWLKSTPLWGNVLVSLYIAFVWIILFVAQLAIARASEPSEKTSLLTEICLFYGLFAFLTNLIREIVKDIEDVDGDRESGLRTTAVAWGTGRSKIWIFVLCGAAILSLAGWMVYSPFLATFEIRMYFLLFVLAPLVSVFIKVKGASKREEYSAISRLLKLIMVAGMVSIYLVARQYL